MAFCCVSRVIRTGTPPHRRRPPWNGRTAYSRPPAALLQKSGSIMRIEGVQRNAGNRR
ncbi:hypothetical protein BURMUCF2_2346 [Burkholderia multivorans CF2]|nr:hypothetical protein BURMUCF2_2346 [Burkholderia multivorans CF2]